MQEWRGRRSIRLQDYDYAQNGAYFVTICTHRRECLFGEIVDGDMRLNALGGIVNQEWLKTAEVRPYVILDEFIIMPNHFHAIVVITNPDVTAKIDADGNRVGARRAVPLQGKRREFGKPVAGSLPTMIGAFKSAVTKQINELRDTPSAPVWQRNYYEHVIRNESSLNSIRSYIQANPANWSQDSENPANVRQKV